MGSTLLTLEPAAAAPAKKKPPKHKAPAAPASTSPGCAPMASTDCCRAASRAARPLATSAAAAACSRSGRTGFCRNSSDCFRNSRMAISADSCAVITATGRSGESRRNAARNSRQVIPGSSASVSTRSQAAELTCRSATAGSGVCVTSNPPRFPSTCSAKWAATASSSTRRIRPGRSSCPVLVMRPPPSPASPRGVTALLHSANESSQYVMSAVRTCQRIAADSRRAGSFMAVRRAAGGTLRRYRRYRPAGESARGGDLPGRSSAVPVRKHAAPPVRHPARRARGQE